MKVRLVMRKNDLFAVAVFTVAIALIVCNILLVKEMLINFSFPFFIR